MKIIIYKTRPKRGNARKAWDKYFRKYGADPKEMYYSPNYDHNLRGWVCEYNVRPELRYGGYANSSLHDFYPSNEL
jgi:hypothetical protein